MGGGGDGGGNYDLTIGEITRETDILRVCYDQNTVNKTGGDVTADGEPDLLEFDMHFYDQNGKLKINVDVSYGDAMISSFSLEKPNRVNVIHYTGFGSNVDPDTHYGICDDSIKDFIKFFNSFGFTLNPKDFSFIDKYPDTYVHENIKLTPLSSDKKILLVNNSKPQESRYFNNLKKYCQNRGIEYVSGISGEDVDRISKNQNIVGVILSGSDFRVTKPFDEKEGSGSKRALEILNCPILGICYGFQTMAKHHGSEVKPCDKSHLDNLILTDFDESHPLFKDVSLDNTPFSFAFNDIVDSCPDGFKTIAKIDDKIAAIANDEKRRYGLLFHPEDLQRTYQVLDNFVAMFDDVRKEQDALKSGQFQIESYLSYSRRLKS